MAKTCSFTTAPSARALAGMQTMFGFVIHPDLIWLAVTFVTGETLTVADFSLGAAMKLADMPQLLSQS